MKLPPLPTDPNEIGAILEGIEDYGQIAGLSQRKREELYEGSPLSVLRGVLEAELHAYGLVPDDEAPAIFMSCAMPGYKQECARAWALCVQLGNIQRGKRGQGRALFRTFDAGKAKLREALREIAFMRLQYVADVPTERAAERLRKFKGGSRGRYADEKAELRRLAFSLKERRPDITVRDVLNSREVRKRLGDFDRRTLSGWLKELGLPTRRS